MFSNSADPSQGQSPCGLSSPGHDSTTLSMVSTSACPSQVQSPCGSSTQISCLGTLPAGLCTSIPSSPSIPALLTTPQASSIWSSSMLGKEQLKMNPFILKFKTKQIKICQAFQKNYDGPNDTLGLVVAHAERRIVSNLATGSQFLGRESNSHYHAHMRSLKMVNSSFMEKDLIIPSTVQEHLTPIQKIYLTAFRHLLPCNRLYQRSLLYTNAT